MKIAYLILCHADPEHIARLCRKLTDGDPDCGVFIHADAKSDIQDALRGAVAGLDRVTLLERRAPVWWGAFSAVEATYLLLNESYRRGYDRFLIVQGAEYPIVAPLAIRAFFSTHARTEFIRAFDTTDAKQDYLRIKPRVRSYRERVTFLKKVVMALLRKMPVFRLPGYVQLRGERWSIYWGSAQFAVTRDMARLFLDHENDPVLKRYFRKIHAPDETWFHTIAHNSAYRDRTQDGGATPEFEGVRLKDTRNLTYFEYPKLITVFGEEDFEKIKALPDLFVRKVTTSRSQGLLDRLDAWHAWAREDRAL